MAKSSSQSSWAMPGYSAARRAAVSRARPLGVLAAGPSLHSGTARRRPRAPVPCARCTGSRSRHRWAAATSTPSGPARRGGRGRRALRRSTSTPGSTWCRAAGRVSPGWWRGRTATTTRSGTPRSRAGPGELGPGVRGRPPPPGTRATPSALDLVARRPCDDRRRGRRPRAHVGQPAPARARPHRRRRRPDARVGSCTRCAAACRSRTRAEPRHRS